MKIDRVFFSFFSVDSCRGPVFKVQRRNRRVGDGGAFANALESAVALLLGTRTNGVVDSV